MTSQPHIPERSTRPCHGFWQSIWANSSQSPVCWTNPLLCATRLRSCPLSGALEKRRTNKHWRQIQILVFNDVPLYPYPITFWKSAIVTVPVKWLWDFTSVSPVLPPPFKSTSTAEQLTKASVS